MEWHGSYSLSQLTLCSRTRECKSSRSCLIAFSILLLLILPEAVVAERSNWKHGDGQVKVQVRTVMGEGVRQANQKNSAADVDEKIIDLSDKLNKLHYERYVLVSSREDVVSMQQKKVMPLGQGYTLALRPMYIEGNRVGMWLKWKDDRGAKLLDTRMHFTCGESVVTGTERSPDSGVILAIDVTPN